VGELSNCRWDLETLMKDNLLALEANIFGPFDEACQICLRTNILADAEVLGGRFKERIFLDLRSLANTIGGGSGLLAGSWFGFGLVIETK